MSSANTTKHHDSTLRKYYEDRAPIYDRVYAYPERQEDLRFLEEYIPEQFVDRDVLEVAAGTGYWSQFIVKQANSLLATDATSETLQHIESRKLKKPVSTKEVDAYEMHNLEGIYDGLFAGLWLSHVPKQRIGEFLSSVHKKVSPNAKVLFIDNSLAQCVRLPLSHTDEFGNTYQDRELDDGSTHRVLKNFPTGKELLSATSEFGTDHKFVELENFWLFQYTTI